MQIRKNKVYCFIILIKSYHFICTKTFVSVINFYQHIKHGGYGMIERRSIKRNSTSFCAIGTSINNNGKR